MPTLDSLSAFQPLSSPCRSSDLSTDGSSIITTAFPKGSFLFYFIGFSGWWRDQGQGGREETSSNKWHRSVAAALIWSKEKDAVWFLSFPGQIMEPNFGSMFPSSQEKKLCKGQGRKWKLILLPSGFSVLTNDTCAVLLCFDFSLQLQGAAPIAPRISDPTTVGFRDANPAPKPPGCSSISSVFAACRCCRETFDLVTFPAPGKKYPRERVCERSLGPVSIL